MSIALEPDTLARELASRQQHLRRRLASVRRRVRNHLLMFGLSWTVGLLFVLLAASVAADWLLRFELPMRLALLAAALAAVAYVAVRRLIRPQLLRLDDLELAFVLDRRQPGVGQRVAGVLQLPELLRDRPLASPAMVRAAVAEQAEELDRTDLLASFNRASRRREAAALGLSLALAVGFFVLWPDAGGLWARRWLLGSEERWPQRNYLSVVGLEGQTLLAPRGEPLLLVVDAAPRFTSVEGGWTLAGRGEMLVMPGEEPPVATAPEQVTLRWSGEEGGAKQGIFTRFGESEFRYDLPPLIEPLSVSVAGGDDWLGPFTVQPIDRPAIERIVVHATPASGGETVTHEGGESQLLFLRNTRLRLEVVATVPLESAALTRDKGPLPAQLVRGDERTYAAEWPLTEALTLEIGLTGVAGRLPSKPAYLSIGLLEDRPPRITLRSSGVGRRVTPQATIPTALRALDDFGLTSLAVEIETSLPKIEDEEQAAKISRVESALPSEAGEPPPREHEEQPRIALAAFAVPPGAVVRLRGAGADNCAEGAQSAAGRWLTFQVVTPEELFYEILMRQRGERAKFASALDTAKSQVETLALPLEPETAGGLLRKHQVIARQVWQAANRLDAIHLEMELNELGSPVARELMQTNIIAPMRELHSVGLNELRTSLESLSGDPAAAEEGRPQAAALQQQSVEAMERILAQMQQWESFVDVLNQVRQIIQSQDSVLEATETERRQRTESVFEDEEGAEMPDEEAGPAAEEAPAEETPATAAPSTDDSPVEETPATDESPSPDNADSPETESGEADAEDLFDD